MKKFRLYFIPVVIGLLVFWGCSEDEDPTPEIVEAEELVKFLESTDAPYGKSVYPDFPRIIKSTDVKTKNLTNDLYIIDIRTTEDAHYDTAHIANAVRVSHKDVLTHLQTEGIAKDAEIAVVCYTGQTAGWVTSLLSIAGYTNAKSMKWGMSSWGEWHTSKWDGAVENGNARSTQIVTEATAKGEAGSLPSLTTGKTTGAEILEARVAAVFAEGFAAAKISADEVWGNLSGHYIVNYWKDAHYTDPGHIPGAMQYTPKTSLSLDADLKTLPTDGTPIVVYCYTGQTSAFMAAYLRVLGYNAKSLLFGTNGMFYDKMLEYNTAHADAPMTVWNEAQKHDYETVSD